MRQAAADRAAVADLAVADQRGRLGEHGTSGADELRLRHLRVPRERADPDAVAIVLDSAEPRDPADVHQGRRGCEPQLHRGQEAVAARERARVLELAEQRDCLVEARRGGGR